MADRVDLPDVWALAWADVDPATRPGFDPANVAALVRALPPAAEIPPGDADWRLIHFWYDRMTEALAEHLGDWVVGWKCTIEMENHQYHGVIPVWRVETPPVTTPAETLSRLADAVVAWHELLVELATDTCGRFAAAAAPAAAGTGDPPAWRAVKGRHGVMVYAEAPWAEGPPHPSRLSWADVDPTDREFESDTVAGVAADLLAAYEPPALGADGRLISLWLERVTAGLVDRYGTWVVGWRWSVGECDVDAGPVSSWCCFEDSVTTPEATAGTISAALVEWHGWLEDLAERFNRFLPLAADDKGGWERAVAHLVTAVGDRTLYESGWYRCFETVLGWFLDAAGVGAVRRAELIEHAIAGRFGSWVEPPREVVASVAEDLALGMRADRA